MSAIIILGKGPHRILSPCTLKDSMAVLIHNLLHELLVPKLMALRQPACMPQLNMKR